MLNLLFIYFSPCIFAEFLMPFLKTQVTFPSNYASVFNVIRHNSSVLFLAQKLYSLMKGANKGVTFLDFQVLESKFVKFLISVLKWQFNSSSNFTLLVIVMAHNSSVKFKAIPFLLWIKGSHQSLNFDTFKCSGENLPNVSSFFSNHKPVFLQNFHNSSVS